MEKPKFDCSIINHSANNICIYNFQRWDQKPIEFGTDWSCKYPVVKNDRFALKGKLTEMDIQRMQEGSRGQGGKSTGIRSWSQLISAVFCSDKRTHCETGRNILKSECCEIPYWSFGESGKQKPLRLFHLLPCSTPCVSWWWEPLLSLGKDCTAEEIPSPNTSSLFLHPPSPTTALRSTFLNYKNPFFQGDHLQMPANPSIPL